MQVKKRPIEVGQIIDLTIRSNRSTEKGQKDLKMRSCLLGHKGPSHIYCLHTGCSLNIVFFSDFFKIFRPLAFLCFPSVSVCVHTSGR